jgi:ABC-2 type transport system permease protein
VEIFGRSAIYAIAWKEMLKIRRNRQLLGSIVAFPVMMLILYGFGLRFDVNGVTLAVLNYDGSQISRDFITRFYASGYFVPAGDVSSYEELQRYLDASRARIGVVIPPDFGRKMQLREKVAVQTLVDGTDSNTAQIALGYFTGISQSYSINILMARLRQISYPPPFAVPSLKIESRVWYNPELLSSHFVVPGIIAIIMMMVGAILTAQTIVQEKESGSIEQLIVSPVRPVELVTGKLIPYLVLAMIDMVLIIGVAYVVFDVPIKGSFLLLFCIGLLYTAVVLGMGVVISTLANTIQSAMLIAFLMTMLPSIMLSGFVFPLENMPAVLQAISYIVPARYFLEIIRGIYLKGTGLSAFWPQVLMLGVFAVLMLTLSTLRFKKRLE